MIAATIIVIGVLGLGIGDGEGSRAWAAVRRVEKTNERVKKRRTNGTRTIKTEKLTAAGRGEASHHSHQ